MAILTPKSPDVRTGHDPRPREWRPPHLIWLAVAAVVAFVVVFWAALGRAPLSGTNVVAVLGFAFVALANLSLGALACGAVIEARHPHWSRLRGIDHVFMYLALAALAAVDGGFAWWLFSSDAGGLVRWLFLVIALAALAGGVWWSWPRLLLPGRRRAGGSKSRWGLWPQHADAADDETWHLFTPLTVLLGAALGVVVTIAYLGISAWHENANSPAGHPLPALLTGIHGGYVALGDSYSAGEGLPPFAPGTALTSCDRSVSAAYPDLLIKLVRTQDHQAPLRFTACSGAVISEILRPTQRATLVPPQIDGRVDPSVGLVTLTIGGNNAIFSKVVQNCLLSGNCLNGVFPPPGVHEATARPIPPGKLLTQWGPATIEQIGRQDAMLFRTLRQDFPNARIVVIGYPYLFPAQRAPGFPFYPPACASILNRLNAPERAGIRALQDDFNNRTYEEAAAAGIEFVSPAAIWTGHEPCGASGQFTNSVKPYLNFPNPVNGGSFHPNAAGQQTLTALLACYLDANQTPPDPFSPGAPPVHRVPAGLVSPEQLHMVPAPGLDSVPGAGRIPGC
jgi:hypothetical protein